MGVCEIKGQSPQANMSVIHYLFHPEEGGGGGGKNKEKKNCSDMLKEFFSKPYWDLQSILYKSQMTF